MFMSTKVQTIAKHMAKARYTLGYGWFAITPADDTQLNNGIEDVVCRKIRVNNGGTLVVRTATAGGAMAPEHTINVLANEEVVGIFMAVQEASTATGITGQL